MSEKPKKKIKKAEPAAEPKPAGVNPDYETTPPAPEADDKQTKETPPAALPGDERKELKSHRINSEVAKLPKDEQERAKEFIESEYPEAYEKDDIAAAVSEYKRLALIEDAIRPVEPSLGNGRPAHSTGAGEKSAYDHGRELGRRISKRK